MLGIGNLEGSFPMERVFFPSKIIKAKPWTCFKGELGASTCRILVVNSLGITPGKSHLEKQVRKPAVKCIHLLMLSVCHLPNIWGLYLYLYSQKGRECVIYLSGLVAEL